VSGYATWIWAGGLDGFRRVLVDRVGGVRRSRERHPRIASASTRARLGTGCWPSRAAYDTLKK